LFLKTVAGCITGTSELGSIRVDTEQQTL
jgi:hypothetical protein